MDVKVTRGGMTFTTLSWESATPLLEFENQRKVVIVDPLDTEGWKNEFAILLPMKLPQEDAPQLRAPDDPGFNDRITTFTLFWCDLAALEAPLPQCWVGLPGFLQNSDFKGTHVGFLQPGKLSSLVNILTGTQGGYVLSSAQMALAGAGPRRSPVPNRRHPNGALPQDNLWAYRDGPPYAE